MYWAANWPAWCRPDNSSVVAELRAQALTWAADWIDAAVAGHTAAGRSWVAAHAHDSFWPLVYTPPATDAVAEASPFLHEDFATAALALPVTARYDAALPTAYQRCKAAVVRLLPGSARRALPARKQYYTHALARAVAGPIDVPVAATAGLLDPDALTAETDTATRMTATAVEAWLAGAMSYGFAVPGVGGGSAA